MRMQMPRAFHVQVADTLTADEAAAVRTSLMPTLDPAKAIVVSKHLAKTAGQLYAAKKLIDTLSEIAIIAAKAKFK